jgi:hypothetical protein
MKKLFVVLPFALLSLTGNTFAQTNSYSAVKLNISSTFTPVNRTAAAFFSPGTTYSRQTSEQKFLQPSVAFQISSKKKNIQEFELTDLTIARRETVLKQIHVIDPHITGQHVTTSSIALRYEYVHIFFKKKDHKLVPGLGIGIAPFYSRVQTSPFVTSDYPTTVNIIGARALITPRLTWYASNRLFADINLSACIMEHYYNWNISKNPTLTANAQRSDLIHVNFFPTFLSARIGVGVKL